MSSEVLELVDAAVEDACPAVTRDHLGVQAMAGHAIQGASIAPLQAFLKQRLGTLFLGIVNAEVQFAHSREERSTQARMLRRCDAGSLFARYEALRPLVGLVEQQWIKSIRRLLQRLQADAVSLAEMTGDAVDQLSSVAPLESDPHNDGQTVCLLTFASGATIVYKPRPVDGEFITHRLFGMLNAEVAGPPLFRTTWVLRRKDYGWMEYVPSTAPRPATPDDAYALGSIAAVAFLLGLGDLHGGNVLLSSGGPVAVDCEVCLGPLRVGQSTGDRTPPGSTAFEFLATHLVPKPSVDGNGNRAMMGGVVNGWWPAHDVQSITRQYEAGYRCAWRRIEAASDRLAGEIAEEACRSNAMMRVLVRGTPTYSRLLRSSLRAGALQSTSARARELRSLADGRGGASTELHRWISDHEIDSLLRMDIPAFYVNASTGQLRVLTGDVNCEAPFPGVSGIEAMRKRAGLITPGAGRRSLELARLLLRAHHAETTTAQPRDEESTEQWDRFSGVVLHRLLKLAVQSSGNHDRRLVWFRTGGAGFPRPVDHSLFEGRAGILLFLSAASSCGLVAALSPAYALLHDELASLHRLASESSISGRRVLTHDGVLGRCLAVAWSRSLLSVAASTSDIDEIASRALRFVIDDFHKEGRAELLDGLAGAILCRLAIANALAIAPDGSVVDAANLLCVAMERELSRSMRQPRGGLAHGLAGCCMALKRVHRYFPDARYDDVSFAAASRVITAFSSDGEHQASAPLRLSWCNGTVGALSATLEFAHRQEIGPAWNDLLSEALQQNSADNDTLCCGTFGAMALGAEYRARGNIPSSIDPQRGHAPVWNRVRKDWINCGSHHWFGSPGLYQGLSGIGYASLQLGFKRRLPSLLTFDWSEGQ